MKSRHICRLEFQDWRMPGIALIPAQKNAVDGVVQTFSADRVDESILPAQMLGILFIEHLRTTADHVSTQTAHPLGQIPYHELIVRCGWKMRLGPREWLLQKKPGLHSKDSATCGSASNP